MEVKVRLLSCRDCRHRDHSGAFTAPKMQIICGHDDACEIRRSKKSFRKFNSRYYAEQSIDKWKYWKHHWWHRVIPNQETLEIPDWCPLKNGSRY